MQQSNLQQTHTAQERLFLSLAESVSHTMLQLSRLGESVYLDTDANGQHEKWRLVQDISSASMQLLDGYVLTMRLQGGLASPEIEALSLGSVAGEVRRMLAPYATQLAVPIDIAVCQGLEPIAADRAILQSALISLGQVFLVAQSQSGAPVSPIAFRAHRNRYGIVAGWYSHDLPLTADAFRRAKRLKGKANQPYAQLISGPAGGVFIAESLLESLAAKLHVARYHNSTGLAVTLPVCRQLQLV